MTEDEARKALTNRLLDEDRLLDEVGGDRRVAAYAVDVVLSAPPEVIAAAMGGRLMAVTKPGYTAILVPTPPREAVMGDEV